MKQRSSSKTLSSVLCHPVIITVGGIAFALSVTRWAFTLYFVLVLADVLLTKYHLWRFRSTQLQAKRYALITGASLGIGRAIACELAKQQYSLVIASRTLANLDKVRADIEKQQPSVEVLVCACDLPTSAGIEALLDFVAQRELVIDILVNNAGAPFTSDFIDLPTKKVGELLTLDIVAMTRLTHGIAPQMVKRGVGRLLNLASVSSSVSIPTAAFYGSSKAFMLNFSQAVNYELRHGRDGLALLSRWCAHELWRQRRVRQRDSDDLDAGHQGEHVRQTRARGHVQRRRLRVRHRGELQCVKHAQHRAGAHGALVWCARDERKGQGLEDAQAIVVLKK